MKALSSILNRDKGAVKDSDFKVGVSVAVGERDGWLRIIRSAGSLRLSLNGPVSSPLSQLNLFGASGPDVGPLGVSDRFQTEDDSSLDMRAEEEAVRTLVVDTEK